ncbi:MAG: DMT family transporter [Bacteroidales bacterium]|jgi:drug/metabolite transporter (DMT)-like permease|nr:DMT family transporter [Bacteroidales bacterium]
MKRKIVFAYLGLFLMTTIVGLSFIFVKIGLNASNSYDLLAHRFSIALVFVVLLKIFGLIKIGKIERKEWLKIIGVSFFYPILCFGFQTVGMEYSTASQAGIIFALLPIFTLIAASLFLKEKSSILQKTGIGISVTGLIFIFSQNLSSSGETNIYGVILMLLSVFSMVVYYMIAKKIMQKHNSITLTSVMIIIGFVVFNLVGISRHLINNSINEFFEPFMSMSFIVSVLYLGILSSVLTSFLTNYALTYISTSNVSVMNNISPIIAILGGVVILGESLSLVQILGGLTVLIGVSVVIYFQRKN